MTSIALLPSINGEFPVLSFPSLPSYSYEA